MTHTILSQILSMMTLLVAPEANEAHGRRHAERPDLCERLECTDAQKTRIDSIREAHRADAADERAEAKRLREALKAERKQASPDAEEIARLQASLDAVKAELRRDRQATKAEISAVLTPEQRERLAAMKAKHEAKRGGKGKGKAEAKRQAKRGGKAEAASDVRGERRRGAKGELAAERGRGGPKSLAKRGRGPKGKAQAPARG